MTDIGPVADHRNDPKFEKVGICHRCVHRTSVRNCKAFPDGIPGDILAGRVMHTQPYAGDRGIQFEPRVA